MQSDLHQQFIAGKTRIKYGGAYTDHLEFNAINEVLERNWWTIDKEGEMLEKELARFVYQKEEENLISPATLVNSGSSALMVAFAALREYGLASGDEIITGGVQFPTTISSLYYNNLVPVYVDVDPGNLCVDTEKIAQAITPKTKAILAVTIAGNIPNIDRLVKIALEKDLLLILDNCDGFGGLWNNHPIESYFDIAVTSFHAAHILAMGEGGAVITNTAELGTIAHSMREWGRYGDTDAVPQNEDIPSDYPGRYVFRYKGFNMKPLELQCAMGRVQLRKINHIRELRFSKFMRLYTGLQDVQARGFIQLPTLLPNARQSWFGFPMFAKDRPGLRKFLESRQIETRTIFGGNITKQPAFKGFGRIADELTHSDRTMQEGMFLSVHPSLTSSMLDYMIRSIHEYYQ